MKKVLQVLCLIFGIGGILGAQQDTMPPQRIPLFARVDPPRQADFKAPLFYEQLWKETMKCTGLHIPMSLARKVKWTFVDADAFYLGNVVENLYVGYTFVWDDRILLTLTGIENHRLVQHEMTHYLMWHHGIPSGHPDKYFQKCNFLNIE